MPERNAFRLSYRRKPRRIGQFMDEREALGLPPTIEQQQSGRAALPPLSPSPVQTAYTPPALPPPTARKRSVLTGLGEGARTASLVIRLIRLAVGFLVGVGLVVGSIWVLVDPAAGPTTDPGTGWAVENFGPNGNLYLALLGGLVLTAFCGYFFRRTLRALKTRKAAARVG